jgi:pilus assembly protein CpaF
MMATSQQVANRARELALTQNADPFDTALNEISRESRLSYQAESDLRSASERQVSGLGALETYMDDETVEEIWINQPNEIFISKSGTTQRIFIPLSQIEIQTLVERMLRHSGRRLDRSAPFVDAALEDGSRLHVVIPDISKKHWSVNIRKFPRRIWELKDLVLLNALTEAQARFLAVQVRSGKNILVSGATQAGKTTLLCALISTSGIKTRLVTVEETFEIRAVNQDWVALQTRQPNLEGKGEVTLRRLVKESLRMRPEMLVVGEVREAESLDLLIAMNSGIPGLCTIHANSAAEAIQKLCTLPLLAGANISANFIEATVASCLNWVVHCKRNLDGTRIVAEIAKVTSISGKPVVEPLEIAAND